MHKEENQRRHLPYNDLEQELTQLNLISDAPKVEAADSKQRVHIITVA